MCAECHLLFIFTATALGKQKGDGRIEYWGIKLRFLLSPAFISQSLRTVCSGCYL